MDRLTSNPSRPRGISVERAAAGCLSYPAMNPPDDDPTRDIDEIDVSDAAADDDEPAWDADDERRRHDQMAPPKEPCECYCLHCHRVFMSDAIWFQKVINSRDGFEGFWMCPTPNCDGAGFTFDIFPTDPGHPANAGWHAVDECDDGEFDDAEYDADETKFKQLDEAYGDEGGDDDIEGEEWKYGLQPGEQPPEPEWAEESRKKWEEEQKQYDEPDQRPRVLDWSDRDETPGLSLGEDDIPY
jgi:hypothetical protein